MKVFRPEPLIHGFLNENQKSIQDRPLVSPLWDSGQVTGLSQHPVTPRPKLVSNQWRKPWETQLTQKKQTPTRVPTSHNASLHSGWRRQTFLPGDGNRQQLLNMTELFFLETDPAARGLMSALAWMERAGRPVGDLNTGGPAGWLGRTGAQTQSLICSVVWQSVAPATLSLYLHAHNDWLCFPFSYVFPHHFLFFSSSPASRLVCPLRPLSPTDQTVPHSWHSSCVC